MPSVTFVGNGDFADAHEPVSGKSEWGMDTLQRTMRGKQTSLVAYMVTLAQGATLTWNSQTYRLQSWECDNNPVFPSVSLLYKGLFSGIPDPFVSGTQIEQTFSISCSSPQNASRDIRYLTRSSEYKYIKSGRPTGPTYTDLDVDIDIVILQSVIRTEDGGVLFGSVSVGLLAALTPAEYNLALMSCVPVFGTPFFECTDIVTKLYGP